MATYHVVRDYASGRGPLRYDVFLRTASDPVVIGRELSLKDVRRVIGGCEAAIEKTPYYGSRREALKLASQIVLPT